MLLNDAMYGILFRDINPRRTLCDQHFSRRIGGRAGIIINTGEDNYLTTADAVESAHTVVASQFINEAFALQGRSASRAARSPGHAFEIDKSAPRFLLMEIAQAPAGAPDLPAPSHQVDARHQAQVGDILVSPRRWTLRSGRSRHAAEHRASGMMTESIHTPLLQDRYAALTGADYTFSACRSLASELMWRPDGMVVARAQKVRSLLPELLEVVAAEGLFSAIARGVSPM